MKIASDTYTDWILSRDKKHNAIYRKIAKKLLKRQNVQGQLNSRFTPATNLKNGTYILIPNFVTQKKHYPKKYNQSEKDHFKLLTNPLI